MADEFPKLQSASSPDGYSIEWVGKDCQPIFEVYRSDSDGARSVVFGTLENAVNLPLEQFQLLLSQSLEKLDNWELDQQDAGFIDEQGRRTI
jgi:hypothetical protein